MRHLVTIATTPRALRCRASAKGGHGIGTGDIDATLATVPLACVAIGKIKRRIGHTRAALDAVGGTANNAIVNVAIKSRAFLFGGQLFLVSSKKSIEKVDHLYLIHRRPSYKSRACTQYTSHSSCLPTCKLTGHCTGQRVLLQLKKVSFLIKCVLMLFDKVL